MGIGGWNSAQTMQFLDCRQPTMVHGNFIGIATSCQLEKKIIEDLEHVLKEIRFMIWREIRTHHTALPVVGALTGFQ